MLSSRVGHILAAAAVLLVAGHAQQTCVGGKPGNNLGTGREEQEDVNKSANLN